MRNIPAIPPSPGAPADAVDVRPVSYLRALQIVGERSLMPLVFPRHRPAANAEPAAVALKSRQERRQGAERRKFSRRIRNKSASLYDTRASEERRRGNRRDSDITTKIQEKI